MVTLPFSPLISAFCTAIDVLGFSMYIAIEEYALPEGNQIRETLDRVADVQRELQEKIDEVKVLRENLELLQAKLDQDQKLPIAARLAGIVNDLYIVKSIADMSFLPPQTDTRTACSPPGSGTMSYVVAVLRRIAQAIESPSIIDGLIAELPDQQLDDLQDVISTWNSCSASAMPAETA